MPEIPDAAVQIVAERMFRRYESEYSAGHLTWRDFADDARADLEAASPVLAEAVAQKILAHADDRWPSGCIGSQPARRHFRTAAQIAAFAFSTREDQLRMAAEAIGRGDVIVCNPPEVPDAG